MTAPTTLRALAAACEECQLIAHREGDPLDGLNDQRLALARAIPVVAGWPEAAAELRTMADTVDALEAEVARLRPLRALCERVIALEHPAALYLAPKLELRINAGGLVISPDRLWIFDGPNLDAVITAACARLGVPRG